MNDKPPPSELPEGHEPGTPATKDASAPSSQEIAEALSILLDKVGINPSDPDAQIVIESVRTANSYKSPIPPPEMLERYGEVVAGLPSKIIEAWQDQQRHRHTIENQYTTRDNDRMDRAQRNALIVAMSGIVAATIVGVFGGWAAASAIVAVCVGGPAGVTAISRWLPPPRD